MTEGGARGLTQSPDRGGKEEGGRTKNKEKWIIATVPSTDQGLRRGGKGGGGNQTA